MRDPSRISSSRAAASPSSIRTSGARNNGLSPIKKQRFKIRSTVKRSNSPPKDWLIPRSSERRDRTRWPLPDDRRAVSCGDQNTAVLHPAEPTGISIATGRTIAIPPVGGQVRLPIPDRQEIWSDLSFKSPN